MHTRVVDVQVLGHSFEYEPRVEYIGSRSGG